MPLRPPKTTSLSLVLLLLVLLSSGFLTTSLVSYYVSREEIRDHIINTELPLTSDTVYSEIQKDLVRPVLISSMMARDTFVRDWVMAGEKDVAQMTRYLNEVMSYYGAFTAFFISENSRTYYQAKGILKQVAEDEPRDSWYFRVREMQEPYEINVDIDMANQDRLTFFINYKVFDYDGRFIGVTGVGLEVDSVVQLIDAYQRRYDRSVYFVDTDGRISLTGTEGGPQGARTGQSLSEVPGMEGLLGRLPNPQSGSYEYSEEGHHHFLNVRFIPELDWYLFVDKQESTALAGIRQTLYLNLLICALITVLVLALVSLVVHRYQKRIHALAITDELTGLPNRRGFDILAGQALQEAQREQSPLCAMLIDLDHFKNLNDSHGHLAGDEVLRGFADRLNDNLRQSDIICRWGGEEFVVLLKGTDSSAAQQIAEKIRSHAEQGRYPFADQELQVTISLGLTDLRSDDSLHSLLARADRALYRAKQTGRNRVCLETAPPAGPHAVGSA